MIIHSSQSTLQQQYQAELPPLGVSEELQENIRVLIESTQQMTQITQQAVEEMKAHCKQQADILKEEEEKTYQEEPSSTFWPPQCQEEESFPQFYGQSYSCLSPSLRQSIFKIEAQEEEPSPIYDHSYSSPHQHYQEEPPPPKSSTLEEVMLAFRSQVEESK